MAFSPDGKIIAVGGYTSDRSQAAVLLFDTATGRSVGQIATGEQNLSTFAFTSDFTVLATAGNETVRLWDVATGRSMTQPRAVDPEFIHRTVLSPDGKTVATLDKTGKTVRLLNPITGQAVGQFMIGTEVLVSPLAFSPDSKMLAIWHGGFDFSKNPPGVTLWNPTTGQRTTTSRAVVVTSFAFSRDGKVMATGGDHKLRDHDSSVQLWNTTTGQPIGQLLTGYTDYVDDVAFSPDSKMLATASGNTVRLRPST
jgi:WD40 repeat protein